MQGKSRPELYAAFMDLIGRESQRERSAVNRRMFSVFLWCFILPALTYSAVLVLTRFGVFPTALRRMMDLVLLVFPISYSLYYLGSQVFAELPNAMKKGGLTLILSRNLKETEWRERICNEVERSVTGDPGELEWIAQSYLTDLDELQYRNRYLTGLSGAVFFLIMEGIDSITDPRVDSERIAIMKDGAVGWLERSADFSQFVGLALFLVLLYLSGSQAHHALKRYHACIKLLLTRGTVRDQ